MLGLGLAAVKEEEEERERAELFSRRVSLLSSFCFQSCMQVGILVSTYFSHFGSCFVFADLDSRFSLDLQLAKAGGKVVFVGMGTPEAVLPTANAFTREVDLIGESLLTYALLFHQRLFSRPGLRCSKTRRLTSLSSSPSSLPFSLSSLLLHTLPHLSGVFRYCSTYPAAISLLASGTLGEGIAKMVTQRYPLEKAAQAFEDLARGKDESGKGVVKVMIGPDY